MRILFVCSGNMCRSPMAAAIAAAKLGNAVVVRSAGLDCRRGLEAPQNAVKVMAERGLDISNHRSTDIDELDITEFDVVVAMSPALGRTLAKLNPRRLEQWDVADPYGGDLATYRAAADAIDAALQRLEL